MCQENKKHMTIKKKGRRWYLLGILFFLAAGIFTLYNLYLEYSAGVASQAIYDELIDEIDDADPSEDGTRPLYEQYPELPMPTVEIDGVKYIGILEIEEADIAIPVTTDWSYDLLETAACRYSGSIYSHDAVICGHNYYSIFAPIKSLDIGAEASFTDVDGNVFHYTLSYTDVISPDDVEGMTTADGSWDLTLFTCTTGGSSRMALRFVLTE